MRRMLMAMACIGGLCMADMASAASVMLENGTVYRGSIVSMDAETLILRDEQGIEMRIPRNRIADIRMQEEARPKPAPLSGSAAAEADSSSTGPAAPGDRSGGMGGHDYARTTLAELAGMHAGERVAIEGRYGRLSRNTTGVPQAGALWYLNDGEHEVQIAGETPKGISSYSRVNWGSRIEVFGVVEPKVAGMPRIRLDKARVIRRVHSSRPGL